MGGDKKSGALEEDPLGFEPYSQASPLIRMEQRKAGAQSWNRQVYSDIADGLNQRATLIGIMGVPEDSLMPAPSIWAENNIFQDNFPVWGLMPITRPPSQAQQIHKETVSQRTPMPSPTRRTTHRLPETCGLRFWFDKL